MNFHRGAPQRRRTIAALELTSMIDVIFLLLIYFICSTTYRPPESELSPGLQTEAPGAGSSAELTPQIVTVGVFDGEPGFSLGARTFRSPAELRGALIALPKQAGVLIHGSDSARMEAAAQALQAARDAGFLKVTYVPVP